MASKRGSEKTLKVNKGPQIGLEFFSYLILAWILSMAGLFSLRNYNMLLPEGNPFSGLPTRWILMAGFAAMVFLWKAIPPVQENSLDLHKWPARLFFWSFMVLGFVLRMQHPERPMGFFWDDHYVVITDIRNVLDFNEHPLLFPFGWREPFFPDFSALVWTFFPKATGIYIVNLSSALLDLVIFWISYLVGKEIGGRRMGLLLMGMEVISKPMIDMAKVGFGNNTSILGCAVATLFFLRVLKKADLSHFIQLGLALGFGALCYVPYRPWTPAILGGVWLWTLNDPKERKFDFYHFVIGPLLLAVWAFLFLYKNKFLPETNVLVAFFTSTVGLILVALLLGVSYGKVAIEEYKKRKGFSKLFGWATAALLTAFLMMPFLRHPNYSLHTSDISVFSKYYSHSTAEGFRNLWNNVIFVQELMFGQVNDVARIPILGDSFFDFYTAACGLLALAYFFARPSWMKFYFVSLFLISQSTAIFANAPHSLRFAAIVFPLLFVGAWGLNRLWLVFLQVMPARFGNIACALLLLGFGGWEIDRNTVLDQIWLSQKSADLTIADQVEKELPGHRVYLVRHHPGFYTGAQDALSEGKEVFRMNDINFIDVLPDEKIKDLCILTAGEDVLSQKRVEKEFPGISWVPSTMWNQGPKEIPFIKYAEISSERLKKTKTKLFQIRSASPSSWRRRCYGRYGLGLGLILYEDRVVRWNDDLPPADTIDWNNSMRIEGDWNVQTSGEYIFKVNSANTLWFFLDGKKIGEVPPGGILVNLVRKMTLSAGTHHVEVVTAFNRDHRVPPVMVIAPGIGTEISLDDLVAKAIESKNQLK